MFYDSVLGRDVQFQLGQVSIDIRNRKVRILNGEHDTTLDMAYNSKTANSSVVSAVIVPPRTGFNVSACLSNLISINAVDEVCVEPVPHLVDEYGLLTPNQLQLVNGTECSVFVYNPFDAPITLDKNMSLGTATAVSMLEQAEKQLDEKRRKLAENVIASIDPNPTLVPDDSEMSFEKIQELFPLTNTKLTPDQRLRLQHILFKYRHAFAKDEYDVGYNPKIVMRIDTGSAHPIRRKPYPIPLTQRPKVMEMIQKMQERGIIEPSCSPWSMPLLTVPKRTEALELLLITGASMLSQKGQLSYAVHS